ncbi:MAG: enoyl-CoA hydratase [Hyphomicrobiaceae bacterium]
MNTVSDSVEDKMIGSITGAVGHVIFNNPAKHNAVSLDMWHRFGQLLDEYESNDRLRAVVISGAGGRAFVSGADISKFESERATKEAVAHYGKVSGQSYEKLLNFSKPTIAKINGYCIGGGMNVAVACDLRFCEENARFAIPAAKLGLGYGYYGVARLSRLVGVSRAMEMFYTARQFPAGEAYEMGLVNKVVSAEELEAVVADVTRRISENAPMTIAAIKASAIEIGKAPDQPNHAKLDAMVQACFDSEDYIEGRRAFMEKRKPQFKGR